MKKDPYKILKIKKGTSVIEIDRAYHRSMLNYGLDPRVAYTDEEIEKTNHKTTEITEAYHILSGSKLPGQREHPEPRLPRQASSTVNRAEPPPSPERANVLNSVVMKNQAALRKVMKENLQLQKKVLKAMEKLPQIVSAPPTPRKPEESVLKPVSSPSGSSDPDSISSVETVFLDFDEYLNS